MGRSSRIVNEEMKKGVWSAREDQLLIDHVKMHGEGQWGKASRQTGLRRCGKSVRLRWLNYLRPGIRRGNISEDEEELIIRLHKLLGNRWSLIAGRLPGRTDNEIKNYWNSTLRRKLGLENHSNKITKEKKPSPSVAASAEDDPHLSKNNGADGGGEGGMIKPTSSMHCFANPIVNEQEDAHPHHDATLSTVELAKPENKTNALELGGEDDDVTWNDFMMDPIEGELDISEFLQTDFSRLCELESTSLPTNVQVGSCSTNNEQPPADYCRGCGSIVVVSAAAADNAYLP